MAAKKNSDECRSGIAVRVGGLRKAMFDTVKFIHDALGIESTWAFVLVIAIASGSFMAGVAFLVDRGYKKTLVTQQVHSRNNLKQRAQVLSADILEFVAERRRLEPAPPRFRDGVSKEETQERWQHETDVMLGYNKETQNQYNVRFGARIKAIKKDFQDGGLIPDSGHENTVFDYSETNILSMTDIGRTIGSVAERLP